MNRASRAGLFNVSFACLIAALIIQGCAPEKKYRFLSFFFDGVPNPNKKTEQVNTVASTDSTIIVRAEIKPEYYYHKPYEEEKCKSCHEEGFSNGLIKPVPDLCFNCHQNFNLKYSVLHGPVALGYCLTCHNHHMSKFEKLLDRSGQQVCFYCHEPALILSNKLHAHIENKNCTECHNPHGGENRGMLNAGSCYSCHENFNSKYKILHGPVSSGNCTACHSSHDSGSKNNLLRASKEMCLFCHNAEQVSNDPAHRKVKMNECTSCHNPHGGEEHYFLEALVKENSNIVIDSVGDKENREKSEQDSTWNNQHLPK